MKKDPCEECLVRACCKIQEFAMWWKCGCDPYELYKLWQHLSYHRNDEHQYSRIQSHNNARIMDRRMKQLKERCHEERPM